MAYDIAADLIDARDDIAARDRLLDLTERRCAEAMEESARLRAIVDAVRAAREAVRSTAARYDAAWTGVELVPSAAQAEEIAARLTESYVAGDALSAALDALLSPAPREPAADVARDAPGVV